MAEHPEFAPIATIACLSVLLPLPWHWRARNIATLAMIFWFFISNLTLAVDAIVWSDNVRIVIPVWCDITTKLMIGANIALPASCLCISMYLEQVASLRQAQSTLGDKRKRQWFEAFMCFGLPIIFMGLHVIVQGHRFDIIEGYGCRPTTYYSIPAIFIVWIPPFIMAAGSVVFSALALRHFVMRRLTFAAHLQASNSALNTSRYLRLVAMASIQMVGSITVTSYNIWFTAMAIPIRQWTTWSDVHSDFGRVDQFVTVFTPDIVQRGYYVVWWMVPFPTFLFVAFFAFGRDAVDEYKKCFNWAREKVFRQTGGMSKPPMKVFTFVDNSNSKLAPVISKPVLQSTTSSEYTLPPYESITRISMSSLHKTFNEPEQEYKYGYQLRDSSRFSNTTIGSQIHNFILRQPKAIGSYSDLSMISPSLSTATVGPSEPTMRGHDEHVKQKFLPQSATSSLPPVSAPPVASPSRLRPLFLLGSGQRQEDRKSMRPVSYPLYGAEPWGTGASHSRR